MNYVKSENGDVSFLVETKDKSYNYDNCNDRISIIAAAVISVVVVIIIITFLCIVFDDHFVDLIQHIFRKALAELNEK